MLSTPIRFGTASLDVSDPRLDHDDCTGARLALALAALRDTDVTCSYQHRRFQRAGVDLSAFRSFEDFARLPMMGPEDVQAADELSLLPDSYRAALSHAVADMPLADRLWRRFTSTGSTGTPKASYYTMNDWEASCATNFRLFSHVPVRQRTRLFNCFHAGHVGGKTTEDTNMREGVLVENRHFLAISDELALKQLYQGLSDVGGFNAISIPPCMPPDMSAKKGVTLDDLLNIDEQNYIGQKIEVIIIAGFPSDLPQHRLRERVWEANALAGREKTRFIDIYASAEMMPIACSCQMDDGLHLNLGNVYTEVIDERTGRHVASGGRGLIAVTGFRHASRFVRYVLGDEATFIGERCDCGRVTPRIRDIRRVMDKERIRSGCAGGGL